MKTFIYSSFIALIVLTGCKGNSFMTQRYTKFGHAAHKNVQQEKTLVKLNKPSNENLKTTDVCIPSKEESGLICANTSIVDQKTPAASAFQSFPIKAIKKPIKAISENAKSFRQAKIYKEHKNTAKGVISTTLKIVLWVVILAVVLGVILLVTLLG